MRSVILPKGWHKTTPMLFYELKLIDIGEQNEDEFW